jgi:ribosomal protein S18 acetylase RimI-like enzyme
MAGVVAIERLGRDVIAFAQCIALDADVFPYPSADFTSRSRRHAVWIARAPEHPRVVGFLASRVEDAVVHVQGLAVDRAARQRGIGRALLRACIDSDLAAGAQGVELSVSVTNRAAIALYESEGFGLKARVRDHYPVRVYGEQQDAWRMWRGL